MNLWVDNVCPCSFAYVAAISKIAIIYFQDAYCGNMLVFGGNVATNTPTEESDILG